MNGFVFLMGSCFCCGQPFTSNPSYVPSIRDGDGVRQPVCKKCIDGANVKRVELGMEPHTIHPQAYEPLPEEELR